MATGCSKSSIVIVNKFLMIKGKMSLHHTRKLSHPSYCFNVMQAVRDAGYPFEEYVVETEDGYLLNLHRIPCSPNTHVVPVYRTPVLLQHGMWSSSADWIVPGEKSLVYLLADNGFDVWLGNSRGNIYSRGHKSLTVNDPQYWDFSWHEMGVFDLPAVINMILHKTSKDQIYYIGHSQGTTTFFVMASTLPTANTAIKAMIGLAPIVYTNHMRSDVLQALAKLGQPIMLACKSTGFNKVLPREGVLELFNKFLNFNSLNIARFSNSILQGLSTYASDDISKNLKSIIMNHASSGTAMKVLSHYAQCTNDDCAFRKYNYGSHINGKLYGSSQPPCYSLDSITVPMVLFYSQHDWLSTPQDVLNLAQHLKNGVILEEVKAPKFNHLDFLWATNAHEEIYEKVLHYIND